MFVLYLKLKSKINDALFYYIKIECYISIIWIVWWTSVFFFMYNVFNSYDWLTIFLKIKYDEFVFSIIDFIHNMNVNLYEKKQSN